MGNRDVVSCQLIEQDCDGCREQRSPDTGADSVPVLAGPGERRRARHETRSADAVRCPAFTHFQMAPRTAGMRRDSLTRTISRRYWKICDMSYTGDARYGASSTMT